MAKMIVIAYEMKFGKIEVKENSFKDADNFSPWAKEYISKAYSKKIMNGVSKDFFDAKSNATRAQVATVIARLYREIQGESK